MTVLNKRNYEDVPSALYTQIGLRVLKSVTLDLTEFSSTYTSEVSEPIVIPSGSFIAKMPSGDLYRVYPRLRTTAAIGTDSRTISVAGNPEIFKPGDVLVGNDDGDAPIGTILSVDKAAGTITLAADSASAIASGNAVGLVDSRVGEVVGFVPFAVDVNSPMGSDSIDVYVGATFYRDRLPYLNPEWPDQFTQMQLV